MLSYYRPTRVFLLQPRGMLGFATAGRTNNRDLLIRNIPLVSRRAIDPMPLVEAHHADTEIEAVQQRLVIEALGLLTDFEFPATILKMEVTDAFAPYLRCTMRIVLNLLDALLPRQLCLDQ